MQLPPELWRAACVIAGLRSGFNDPRRAARRDRGDAQNLLGDITGAAAELAVLKLLEDRAPGLDLRYVAVSFQNTVDAPDIDGDIRLEVKLIPMGDPRRQWSLVNARTGLPKMYAHDVPAMIPVFGLPGAAACVIGRGVTPADIEGWQMAPDNVSRNDPAYGRRTQDFIRDTVGRSKQQAETYMAAAGDIITTDQLVGWARAVRARYPQIAEQRPHLGDCAFSELVIRLSEAVRGPQLIAA